MVAQEHRHARPSRRRKPPVLTPVPIGVTVRALDRLPWLLQHRVVLAGVRVLIRSTGEQHWDRVLEHVPRGRPFSPQRKPHVVYSFTPAGAAHLLEPTNQHVLYQGTVRL